jgi:glyoxylase-like metal-dependent hydrolase (beta-lactamase superfamily II)
MKTWTTKSGYRIIQILSGRSNVFLLTNGKQHILIDTSPKSKWDKLVKRLEDLDIKHIDYLILTHTHFDHAGNAHSITQRYNSKVIVHREEAAYLTSGDNIVPNGTNPFTRILVRLFAKRFLQGCRYKPCQYDILVDSSFDLSSFGFNATIIHTPGHSIGSMSVVVENEVAVVGDAMFGVFPGSVFPPYATDVKQMIDSWGVLLKTGCSLFLPAHGSANSRSLLQKDYDKRKLKKTATSSQT